MVSRVYLPEINACEHKTSKTKNDSKTRAIIRQSIASVSYAVRLGSLLNSYPTTCSPK